MNKHRRQLNDPKKRRSYRGPKGHSMAEMAAILPVLALLLLAATDFGRLYYTGIEVANAARAGAQYGSQSLIAAADFTGMASAAKTDASNLSSLSASAKQCTCMSSTTVAACPATYCSANPQATFVEVDTSTTFSTLIKYPGVPSKMTLAGKAVMRVEQ
jgi:Flp pilus assembly protein TadG